MGAMSVVSVSMIHMRRGFVWDAGSMDPERLVG